MQRSNSLVRNCGWLVATAATLFMSRASADGATFDLDGPTLVATVTRGNITLPIDEIPNLSAGDRLSLRADLSPAQSVHYLMVLVFLRGATNPPPAQWFHPCETWLAPCRDQGIVTVVPEGATQALILLAPSARGGLRTVVDAVTGRPGAFVRASQALRQASLERSRLETYVGQLTAIDRTERDRMKEAVPLLARSLGIKIDEHCADRAPELQLSCLMQRQETMVLNDGHSASVVDALTSGPSADLAMVAANTPALGGGYYGPYVASLLNLGRIVSGMRTAKYQYLPALAMPARERLQLSLNSPPSFHEPMSVMVATLPTIASAVPPPLRAAEPTKQYCASRMPLVLAVDGAPLAFSTHYAHDMKLRLSAAGEVVEVPAVADAGRGGYTIDGSLFPPELMHGAVNARLHGSWGFENYSGPAFRLIGSAEDWARSDSPEEDLLTGRDNDFHLHSNAADCVAAIDAEDATGTKIPLDWKPAGSGVIALKMHLQAAAAGTVTLHISEFGLSRPVTIAEQVYPDVVRIDAALVRAADQVAVVRGHRLDEIAALRIDNSDFIPSELLHTSAGEELTLRSDTAVAAHALAQTEAQVRLRGGRTLQVPVSSVPAMPVATLISKTVDHVPHGKAIPLLLAGNDDIAPNEVMRFALRLDAQEPYTPDMTVEVATSDGRLVARLELDQGLQLEDTRTLIARFSPAELLGPNVFGALRYRLTTKKFPGAWQEFVRVVRLPELDGVACAHAGDRMCRVTGRDLYLLATVSAGSGPGQTIEVPDGYTEDVLQVPAPSKQGLYVSFRDEPGVSREIRLPSRRRTGSVGSRDAIVGNSDEPGEQTGSQSEP